MFVVVSYVPLFREQGQITFNPGNEKTTKTFDKIDKLSNDIHIKGCLWMNNGKNKNIPVLILDNAKEVYEHLVEWSENEPENWFTCYIKRHDDIYYVILYPNIERSIERCKILTQLNTGYPVLDKDINILFKPLVFESKTLNLFKNFEKQINKQKKFIIGFLNSSDIDENNIELTDKEEIMYIKNIKTPNNKENKGIESYINNNEHEMSS